MEIDQLQGQQRFFVRQRLTMMANKYVVSAARPDGSEGEVVAFAQQKRMAFKEQVTLYTDESKREVLCAFKGLFRKNFQASLLRSTWHLNQPGRPEAIGQERSVAVAIIRRLWDFIPGTDRLPFAVPYHFDFVTGGEPVMSVTKRFGVTDRYVVDVPVQGLDRRLAIAQAVALDALQSR